MAASTAADATTPTVVFKRKRGPASRIATTSSSTSTNAAGSSSSSHAGPSRASHSATNTTSNRMDSDSDEEGSGASSAVIVKKKRANHNPLVQSTGAVSRRSKLGGAASDEEQDEVYGIDSEEASRGTLSYRDRLSDSTTTRSTSDSLQKIRDDATRHSNWDLEDSAPTSFSAAAANNTSNSNADGLYRGAKGYSSFITARDDGTSSKMRSRGPIRQTTTVRTTSLMDYQPDICKDYKETGYCGFGDTCKFLHDRSDYLAGWQLDVLPNSTSRTREDLLSDPEAEESEEEIPFACLICRQPFEDPVVTRCGHYFCSACAIKRFAKNSKCFACGAQTGGLFNSAKKVLDKMGRRKEQKMQAREEKNSWRNGGDEKEQAIAEFGGSDDEA